MQWFTNLHLHRHLATGWESHVFFFQNKPISLWQGFNEVLETSQRELRPSLLKSITQLLQFYQQDIHAQNNLKNLNLNKVLY